MWPRAFTRAREWRRRRLHPARQEKNSRRWQISQSSAAEIFRIGVLTGDSLRPVGALKSLVDSQNCNSTNDRGGGDVEPALADSHRRVVRVRAACAYAHNAIGLSFIEDL